MQRCWIYVIFAVALVGAIQETSAATEYFGRYIGPLSRLLHSVSGDVYAVDARTLHIRDFTYDGEGPAAFFYAGNSKAPGPGGFIVRDETGSNGVLKRYNKKHITITLPEGKSLNNIRWFSVWCDEFQVNFGDIQIPRGLDFPKPQKVGALSGVHAVASDNIVIVDAQTLLIPAFSYDGEAPDAKFWVGRGPKPNPQGIRVPDENGKQNPLRRYDRKTIVLTLPGDLTIFDIGHFGIWCEAFTVDFGHVQIPPALNVPPSLKMLGVSPQSKLNCEVLSDEFAFEVRWAVAGDSIVIQLVAKIEDREYMSFGLSGDDRKSVMDGGDVALAWVDQVTLNGYADDYFLESKAQCAGKRGVCPDFKIEPNTDSIRTLNAALVNGYSIVTYQRPLKAHDRLDKPIFTNRSQPIIWAIGPLNSNSEASYHGPNRSKGDVFMDFGRPPKWNCPIPESDATPEASNAGEVSSLRESDVNQRNPSQRATEAPSPAPVYKTPPPPSAAPTNGAWEIPPIQCNEPEDGVFYAQMGPTGGKRGYSAITGHVGWGISYYINGLLIPEINVVRGRTYTFVVEGGNDPNIPAKFHPFYITDDPVGGYHYKTPEERRKVNIYAGAELNKHGEVVPSGVGRLCNWTPDPEQPQAEEFASFGAYQRTLTLVCDHGEPAVVQWTPDKDTPDTVYYQCFSHRYLGWKIRVHDRCDLPSGAASDPVPSVVLPEAQDELQAKPSIIVSTRVKPDFPSQSLIDTKVKNYTKTRFPFEIIKPAYNVKRPNVTEEHVIPVKEEVEDIPESSTTHKPGLLMNGTLTGATALPVMMGPLPFRNGFGNGNRRLPTRRPEGMIMIRRPIQQMMKPHQHIPLMNRPMVHMAPSQARPVIVKKPILRIPQRPMMMQAAPTRPLMPQQPSVMPSRAPIKAVYVQKFKKPVHQSFITPAPTIKTKIKMQPSQMISQSSEELTTRLPIAVNTGFNPGSLVIESGFKPIIQTPHAEERVSEIEYDDSNEGVINMDNLGEQKSHTEMFEPMFIPSPLDSNTKHTKKATTEPVKKIRKPFRQVIVRRPVYTEEPLFRSEPDLDETTNDKVESYYVPPTRTTTVHTYDGKSVPEDKVPAVPANHRPAPRDSEELKNSPQFGPYKGDAPPPVPKKITNNIPQLNLQNQPVSLPLKTEEETSKKTETTKQEPLGESSEVEIVTVINVSKEERRQRRKRWAHHEPGHHEDHSEHNEHNDEEHDHSQHNHSQHMKEQTNTSFKINPFLYLTLLSVFLAKFF